jgi:NAD(P)-dependent dehydrogenase (short-subunit alcohol dehydrogenase family)
VSTALTGQRALVIGGGSGIGLASARLLATDGAQVTIAGRGIPKLEAATAQLAGEGLTVAWTQCDAMDGPSVKAAVATAGQDGKLDIAAVVPGGGAIGSVLLAGDDEFGEQVDRNVRPVFLALKYAGHAMVRNGSGSFVAISSTAANFSSRYLASYCAGKAAVDQLIRVAADELGPLKIRINSVRPGMTHTPATEGAFANAPMIKAFVDGVPLGRLGEPGDIAAAVRFMAGPESSWVTGQLLTIDGGHTLRAFVDYAQLLPLPDVRAEILAMTDAEQTASDEGTTT